ncbi:DUF1963 domain-containing protein [Winogradskya consettensis]|uniref:DUF1963 domain-containing protein n=1 Tax=Winogradskya consettensis TaxID=113560 RepID=A0A919VTG3_9ACTN|nr:YwqG family protein [Actinoplanes consettensis]GIM75941.1 hypothetical protein Aco04nite_47860 [Actinoplanes consettensis]
MNHRDRFLGAAGELGVPADEAALFADELLRFRVRAGDRADGVAVGRFGGMPHLPAGVPWPSSEPGAPLAYIGSLDCAALPKIDGLALPEAGSLLFFLDALWAVDASMADEQKYARVVYVPAGEGEEVTELPPNEHDMYDEHPLADPARELFASVEPDLPDWLDSPVEWQSDFEKDLFAKVPHCKELSALVDRLWPGRIPWIGDGFLVGGYSNSAQDSPETGLAEMSGRPEHEVLREWVPLVQFAAPHEEYTNGRFLIRHEDLAAGRFDKALSFCEFTE